MTNSSDSCFTSCEGRGLTVDVDVLFSKDLGSLVDGVTRSVEDSTLHIFRNGELHAASRELDVGSLDIDTGGSFKDLDDSFPSGNFENLSTSSGAVRKGELDDLVVGRELDVVENDERTWEELRGSASALELWVRIWIVGPK